MSRTISEEVILWLLLAAVLVFAGACVSRQPDALPPKLPPAPRPTFTPTPLPGTARANPAPIGQAVRLMSDGGEFEVGVAEVLRGEAARIKLARELKPLAGGMEYLLVHMRGTCLRDDGGDGSYFGFDGAMTVYAHSRGIVQTWELVHHEVLAPDLMAKYTAGAYVNGWVVLRVPPDEPRPVLLVKDLTDAAETGAWFALWGATD